MLGRVQERNQLYIIGSLPEKKIYTDKDALRQLSVMKEKSLNNNRPVWEKAFPDSYKVVYLNIHSLNDKFEDVKADLIFPFADLIIFGETWLKNEEESNEYVREDTLRNSSLNLNEYQAHFNSKGNGKGLATYFSESKFSFKQDIKEEYLQVSVFESESLTVIGIYRSKDDKNLLGHLRNIIPMTGSCLVIGDLNLCTQRKPNHKVFESLRLMHFKLLNFEATHLDGGHIDQAWLRTSPTNQQKISLDTYSPYYTAKDHDALLFSFYDSSINKGKYNPCRI